MKSLSHKQGVGGRGRGWWLNVFTSALCCRTQTCDVDYSTTAYLDVSNRVPFKSIKELLNIIGDAVEIKMIPDIRTDIAHFLVLEMMMMGRSGMPERRASVNNSSDCELLTVSRYMPTEMLRTSWKMSQFQFINLLHVGYASKVYSALCLISSRRIVMKQYNLSSLTMIERIHLFREITTHSQLSHPYIAQFYAAFKSKNSVFLIIENVQGITLRNYLKYSVHGRLSEQHAVSCVISSLLHAVHYLHSRNILHRDIKPENIMMIFKSMNTNGNNVMGLKLIDFGLAIDLNHYKATTRAGTLQYMAPEVLACKSKKFDMHVDSLSHSAQHTSNSYDTFTDIWAIGVLTYEILVGVSPFLDDTDQGTLSKISTYVIHFPSHVSPNARDFIKQTLAWDKMDRANVEQLMSHYWVRNRTKPMMDTDC